MKRDDDFLRDLLISLEERESYRVKVSQYDGPTELKSKWQYHLMLLVDLGYLVRMDGAGSNTATYRMTAQGHDFLAAIRNEGIWHDTKNAAASVGHVTISMLKDIATSYAKAKIADTIGISF